MNHRRARRSSGICSFLDEKTSSRHRFSIFMIVNWICQSQSQLQFRQKSVKHQRVETGRDLRWSIKTFSELRSKWMNYLGWRDFNAKRIPITRIGIPGSSRNDWGLLSQDHIKTSSSWFPSGKCVTRLWTQGWITQQWSNHSRWTLFS
jgi:hypothetical protein